VSVGFVAASKLPTPWGVFTLHGFEDSETGKEHIAITYGKVDTGEAILARVHSECLTGDSLFSLRCDCGSQLQTALENIAAEGAGVILYLRQEGRGIGLINKIRAYELQDAGADTVEANEQLGFDADLRDYTMCKYMFAHLRVKKLKLMTNNPVKVKALVKFGLEITERIPLRTGVNTHNLKYLATKAEKFGHLMEDEKEPGN
jgi:GTP cyclohydrolase II